LFRTRTGSRNYLLKPAVVVPMPTCRAIIFWAKELILKRERRRRIAGFI